MPLSFPKRQQDDVAETMGPGAQVTDLLESLQTSLARGSLAQRVTLLRRVTDLFLHRAGDYEADHIEVFDDVFGCLVEHIHDEARVLLSQRLAPVPTAPKKIIQRLALHDLIEVAAPVLSQSEQLGDDFLIDAARSRSQKHLLAIASRNALSGGITDVLVERGDDAVVQAVSANPKAELTEIGYGHLVARADCHDWIATCIQMRPDMPRHHYLRLATKATQAVQARLAARFPGHDEAIAATVHELAEKVRTAPTSFSDATLISHEMVRSLHAHGRLDDRQVAEFAEYTQFDEISAALACLAHIPVTLAEAIMIDARDHGLFILGRACDLSWPTVRAILALRARMRRHPEGDFDAGRAIYLQLRNATARQVLRFYHMQKASAAE